MKVMKGFDLKFKESEGEIRCNIYEVKDIPLATMDLASIKDYELNITRYRDKGYFAELSIKYIEDLMKELKTAKKELQDSLVETKNISDIESVKPTYFG